jgi:ribonuclease Y
MLLPLAAGLVVAIAAAVAVARVARQAAAQEAGRAVAQARADALAARRAGELEAAALRRAAETAARAEVLEARAASDRELDARAAEADRRAEAVARGGAELDEQRDALEQRAAALEEIQREVGSRRDRATGLERDVSQKDGKVRQELEQRAGIGGAALMAQLGQAWIDDAKARAAAAIRAVEQTVGEPAHDREAQRVMEIAGSRIGFHYLTERAVNNLRCGPEMVSLLLDSGGALHQAIQTVAGVQLLINDDKDAVRLDGLDGVGKEFVRRAISRMIKKPESIDDARAAPEEWSRRGRGALEQEIRGLGKKAFQTLGIGKAAPEIIELVGALNFRTSYTQNQWWHAVESAYLAGMMAGELGLDEKLARRATLMHDIGKALTHKIEGSHAVIGADIARRVGESELVANAIGAHHADEPCNSVYAYLVAASDAMSGGRPGARRELAEGFTAKIEDLERIGMSRRGVAFAHAVQGGRELRVYVRERDVDDLTVVEMSSDIAHQIAEEMTFPGQIKVTVIRSFEASATAN